MKGIFVFPEARPVWLTLLQVVAAVGSRASFSDCDNALRKVRSLYVAMTIEAKTDFFERRDTGFGGSRKKGELEGLELFSLAFH